MKPTEVPDDALLAALVEYHNDGRDRLDQFGYGHDDADAIARAIAAASDVLLPAHERQVRESLVSDLGRAFSPLDPADDYDMGVLDAIAVVRSDEADRRPMGREELLAALQAAERGES